MNIKPIIKILSALTGALIVGLWLVLMLSASGVRSVASQQAKGAAVLLAEVLTPAMAIGNQRVIEDILETSFSSEAFRTLAITDGANRTLFQRKRPSAVNRVPGWFLALTDIEIAEASLPLARAKEGNYLLKVGLEIVEVQLQLWGLLLSYLAWAGLLVGVVALLLWQQYRVSNRDCKLLELEMRGVGDQEQEPGSDSTRLSDHSPLSPFLTLFRESSREYKEQLNKAHKKIDRLVGLSELDSVTGGLNRRGLNRLLDQPWSDGDEEGVAIFCLVRFTAGSGRDRYQGWTDDAITKRAFDVINAIPKEGVRMEVGRIEGALFGLIIHSESNKIPPHRWFNTLILSIAHWLGGDQQLCSGVGVAAIRMERGLGLDKLLRAATLVEKIITPGNPVTTTVLDTTQLAESILWNRNEWLDYLATALKQQKYDFILESCFNYKKSIAQKELLTLRLFTPSGTRLSKEMSRGLVNQFGLSFEYDGALIDAVIARMSVITDSRYLVILSPETALNAQWLTWIIQRITRDGEMVKRLSIVIPEIALLSDFNIAMEGLSLFRQHGVETGVGELKGNADGLLAVQRMKPDFVLLNPLKTVHEENDCEDNQKESIETILMLRKILGESTIPLMSLSSWDQVHGESNLPEVETGEG